MNKFGFLRENKEKALKLNLSVFICLLTIFNFI